MQKFFILHGKMLKQLQMSKTQSFLSWTIYMEVIGFFLFKSTLTTLRSPTGLGEIAFHRQAFFLPFTDEKRPEKQSKGVSLFSVPLGIEGLNWIGNPSNGNKTSITAEKEILLGKATAKVGHRQ